MLRGSYSCSDFQIYRCNEKVRHFIVDGGAKSTTFFKYYYQIVLRN